MEVELNDEPRWFTVQVLSNKENQAKKHLDKFIVEEEMTDYIKEVLLPTEVVSEVKNGKKSTKVRKLYPGYVFLKMHLYDRGGTLINEPYYFVRNTTGVIGFLGGEKPVPLKDHEVVEILKRVEESEGKEVPKVNYEVGEEVKIIDGPFQSLTGKIDNIDFDRGILQVSVSIFGRFTPVELEYWQVEKHTD